MVAGFSAVFSIQKRAEKPPTGRFSLTPAPETGAGIFFMFVLEKDRIRVKIKDWFPDLRRPVQEYRCFHSVP